MRFDFWDFLQVSAAALLAALLAVLVCGLVVSI